MEGTHADPRALFAQFAIREQGMRVLGCANDASGADETRRRHVGQAHPMKSPWLAPGQFATPAGYAFAIFSTVAAYWLLRFADVQAGWGSPAILLTLPILFSAYLGGMRAGLASTATACVAMHSMSLVEPTGSTTLAAAPSIAIVGVVVSWVIGSLHHAGDSGAADAQAPLDENPAIESEREFSQAMLESMPGVLYFYTEQGEFLRWNQNLERATGYSRDEIAKLHPLALLADDQQHLVGARIQDVFTHGEAVVESALRAKDGTAIPYYFTGKRMMFHGEPCLVGVGIDISDRKRAEQRLQATESTLTKAQRIAKMGSWELEIASGRLHWSEEIYRIFGVAPDAFPAIYEGFLAAVHPDDRGFVNDAQELGLAGQAPYDIEHRIVRPDGEILWVHEQAELEHDRAGVPVRFIGTVLDITAAKHAEQALRDAKDHLEQTVAKRTSELQVALVRAEAADRVKSAFLATMSHELRTPLNSILGFTGIVLHGMAGPLTDEQGKQLGMVRDSARHLLELINDVLDISKIEAQQMTLSLQAFDVHEVVARATASVGPLADRKGLQLEAFVEPAIGPRIGDRRRVQQVLLNLLSNAIKFTEQGHVRLTVDLAPMPGPSPGLPSHPTALRIRVADSGIGIKPDDLETLFRPFKQLEAGMTREHEGTGLGLAICSRLVALMGGTITVDSQWLEGSEFAVLLPLPSVGAS